ncbi:MAG: LysM peptidoglycan-binding domain-containing protein [Minisyncoccales bacterium]
MLDDLYRHICRYSLKLSPLIKKQGFIVIFLSILICLGRILIEDNYRLTKSGFSLAEAKITENQLFFVANKGGALEPPEFILIQNSILKASTPLTVYTPQILGSLVAGYEPTESKKIITEYIVEDGDTLWSLAAKFDISIETILWANNLSKNSVLKPGQKLIILPVSGVLHFVKSGDTLSDIAKRYQGKVDEIIAFNQLANENDIYIGDIIIVPNGVMPQPSSPPSSNLAQIPLANNYFIAPVSVPYRITQGLHWYNAIDFGGKCGSPIFAAASGEVIKVALTNSTSRWAFGGGGNHIKILHPNGVVTYYGHIATSLVKVGDKVSQGEIIALIGGQPGTPGAGLSTGCHVHFSVIGAVNPFGR